jgi:starch-binding outer membrane protein, SusD/RagB family
MKKINYKLIVITISTVCIVGCNDKLNIQPTNNIDAGNALLTSKDVKGALVGAYTNLGSNDLYSGGIQVYSDLLAYTNDIIFQGTFQNLTQINNKAIPINNSAVTNLWTEAYLTINSTNEVLNSLSVVNSVDKDQVEGEAKFIRACMYFELVKLFGRAWNDGAPATNLGVPLILKPTHALSDAESKPKRNTVAEVYAQIISDLNDAEAKVQPPDNVTYYYATPGAAAAMLSRVYLAQQDYTNALAAANRVITSPYYKLTNTYGDEFPYTGRGVRIFNTSEDIFAEQFSEQSGISIPGFNVTGFNNMNTFFASSDKGGRGDIEATDTYLATYEAGDDRLNLFADDGSGSTFYCTKWDNVYGNVKIVRLAEMYLTRAECNLRLGTTTGDTPINDINVIRARVKLSPLVSVTLSDVLKERHFELACEGQWLADYKRTNTSVGTLTFDSPSLIFPIPQREMVVNPNLVQNAGYN